MGGVSAPAMMSGMAYSSATRGRGPILPRVFPNLRPAVRELNATRAMLAGYRSNGMAMGSGYSGMAMGYGGMSGYGMGTPAAYSMPSYRVASAGPAVYVSYAQQGALPPPVVINPLVALTQRIAALEQTVAKFGNLPARLAALEDQVKGLDALNARLDAIESAIKALGQRPLPPPKINEKSDKVPTEELNQGGNRSTTLVTQWGQSDSVTNYQVSQSVVKK